MNAYEGFDTADATVATETLSLLLCPKERSVHISGRFYQICVVKARSENETFLKTRTLTHGPAPLRGKGDILKDRYSERRQRLMGKEPLVLSIRSHGGASSPQIVPLL